METELSELYLQNGSDHAVVTSYSGLYEECDVEHINVPPQPTRAKPCVLETLPQRADNFAHAHL